MSQFRNLWDGLKFGLSMLSGAILSVLFGSLGDTRPDMRTIKLVFAIQFIVGAVLGGVAWQFYKALRDWKPKS